MKLNRSLLKMLAQPSANSSTHKSVSITKNNVTKPCKNTAMPVISYFSPSNKHMVPGNANVRLIALGVIIVCGSITSCAVDDPHRRAKTGAAIGAATGAILGHQLDGKSGRYYGAALGALAGGGLGHYMDKQQQHFEQELQGERSRNELQIERLREETLKITLDGEVSFDYNSDRIKSPFRGTLDKLANLLQRYDRSSAHVVGHTDNSGSNTYNRDLSYRRALAVTDYLNRAGVNPRRLSAEGAGEREPRASNRTEAGRQLNRRVEILIESEGKRSGGGYESSGSRYDDEPSGRYERRY